MHWKPITLTLLLSLCPLVAGAQLGPGHSGSWYWAEQDGHGFSIEIGQTLSGEPLGVVYWYTYNNVGHPIFLLGTGTPVGDVLEVSFLSPWGMAFGVFDPETMHYPGGGVGVFVFTDENNATFQYDPSEFTQDTWGHAPVSFMPLTKLFGIPVTESQQIEALEARVAQLETLLQDMSRLVDPNTGHQTLRFEGVNVQVVNGTGSTDGVATGTGNMIIGYNELDHPSNDVRNGSHMLIIGSRNDYTIDSYGGMVVGDLNQTSAPYASVTGGTQNHASGNHSSVSGGRGNRATANSSAVSGGMSNISSGFSASVSGGEENTANGRVSSVSGGGYRNRAVGEHSSVLGGAANVASGEGATISGGHDNTASGDSSSILGGNSKTAAAYLCTVGDDGTDC